MLFVIIQIANAQVPHLMGMTFGGGTNNAGVIFKLNGDSSGFQSVYNFQDATGSRSHGSFCKADNGLYYAIADNGLYGHGVIFSFDASTNTYTDVVDINVGLGPMYNNNFIKGPNGKLYGTIEFGGDSAMGAIFSFDPTNNSYTVLHSFDSANMFLNQLSCTLLQLPDGFLYGMCEAGGGNNVKGGIFRLDTAGNNYGVLYTCIDSTGFFPHGNFVQYSNGLLYGVTNQGGTNTYGVIYSFDVGTNTYTDVFNFDGLVSGQAPQTGLTLASNGLLYGMTASGGISHRGTIFSFDPATNLLTVLHSFNLADGGSPFGGLIQASDGKLYGMTENGGINQNSLGVVFSYNITTSTYTIIHHFHGADGKQPYGNLIELIDSTTTVDKEITKEIGVSVYPDPAKNTITIHQNNYSPNQQIIMTDVLGNKVLEQVLNNASLNNIDISQLSTGVYFYEVRSGISIQTSIRGKVIKE